MRDFLTAYIDFGWWAAPDPVTLWAALAALAVVAVAAHELGHAAAGLVVGHRGPAFGMARVGGLWCPVTRFRRPRPGCKTGWRSAAVSVAGVPAEALAYAGLYAAGVIPTGDLLVVFIGGSVLANWVPWVDANDGRRIVRAARGACACCGLPVTREGVPAAIREAAADAFPGVRVVFADDDPDHVPSPEYLAWDAESVARAEAGRCSACDTPHRPGDAGWYKYADGHLYCAACEAADAVPGYEAYTIPPDQTAPGYAEAVAAATARRAKHADAYTREAPQ